MQKALSTSFLLKNTWPLRCFVVYASSNHLHPLWLSAYLNHKLAVKQSHTQLFNTLFFNTN